MKPELGLSYSPLNSQSQRLLRCSEGLIVFNQQPITRFFVRIDSGVAFHIWKCLLSLSSCKTSAVSPSPEHLLVT